MMDVATCIVREHDLRLLAMAVLVCIVGSVALGRGARHHA